MVARELEIDYLVHCILHNVDGSTQQTVVNLAASSKGKEEMSSELAIPKRSWA